MSTFLACITRLDFKESLAILLKLKKMSVIFKNLFLACCTPWPDTVHSCIGVWGGGGECGEKETQLRRFYVFHFGFVFLPSMITSSCFDLQVGILEVVFEFHGICNE